MSSNKNYSWYSFRITVLVILMLVGVSFIPPLSVGEVHLRRTNIISDIYTFHDEDQATDAGLTQLDREFVAEGERTIEPAPEIEVTEEATPEETAELIWHIHEEDSGEGSLSEEANGSMVEDEYGDEIDGSGVIKFEDHTTEDGVSVSDFVRLLGTASRNRVVRIAFLGDSYIEGDIITGDVREQLQDRYSGHGVGFVAFGTPLATARATVAHTFNGWTNYNLINKRTTPEQYKDKYAINGVLSVPSRGAWSLYKGVNFRRNISEWSRARLIYVNEGSSEIKVTVNDSIENVFRPDPSPQIQQLNLSGTGMKKLRVSVEKADGFVGYGVVLEGSTGVSVDNFSIRSNSGLALFGTDSRANGQLGNILGYDMIVLQYGLNAMDPNNTNYRAYGEQLRKVINYIKGCFPRSAIVLMGVGDRSTQRDGRFVTMSAVTAMIKEQRAVAEDCGIAFWDTFEAMGGPGSMAKFVEWNWAAKDYTHLSYRGGKHIATKFVEALEYERSVARKADAERERELARGVAYPRGISVEIDLSTIPENEEAEPLTIPGDGPQENAVYDSQADSIPVGGHEAEDCRVDVEIPEDVFPGSEADSLPDNTGYETESLGENVTEEAADEQ